MVYILIILLIFSTSCSNKNKTLDAKCGDIYAKITSSKTGGDTIKINDKENFFEIDITKLKPWKIEFCNIDGGEAELALGVYKKTPQHDEMAKRLFLYNVDFKNKRLKPKVRISRLNNPMVDFTMTDIDKDGFDEILSIEKDLDGKYNLNGYDYINSFVFNKNYSSVKLDEEPKFLDDSKTLKIKGKECEIYLDKGEIKWQRKDI